MGLEFPLLVRSVNFCFFCLKSRLRGWILGVPSPRYPREGIQDVFAGCSFIRTVTARYYGLGLAVPSGISELLIFPRNSL